MKPYSPGPSKPQVNNDFILKLKKPFLIFVTTFLPLLLISCKDQITTDDFNEKSSRITNSTLRESWAKDSVKVLGKKLENPSTLTVMELAYQNVKKINKIPTSISKSPVRVTHRYIKFNPKDWLEYDILRNKVSKDYVLYDYPLDYEIIQKGNSYHDPEIIKNKPTYQYAVVRKDFDLNFNVKYKIISEIYIPEFDDSIGSKDGKVSNENHDFIEEWIAESLRLTKNDNYIMKSKNAKVNWTPSGSVKTFDSRLGYAIPLEGVRVECHRFLTTFFTFTNSNGDYSMFPGSFTFGAQYSVIFETNRFDVRSGGLGQAYYDASERLSGPWHITFGQGSLEAFYSDVFRGAYRYNYGNIFGLVSPSGFSLAKVKYGAYNSQGSVEGDGGGIHTYGLFTDIRIWRYYSGLASNPKSDQTFASTIHESAHEVHRFCMGGSIQFDDVSDKIVESWASAVELWITRDEYQSRGLSDYASLYVLFTTSNFQPISLGHQLWLKANATGDNINYSNLFIDLEDTFNQAGGMNYISLPNYFSYYGIGHNDPISGYSIAQLQIILCNSSYGLSSLATNLKNNKPSNVTNEMIDTFLQNY